MNNNMKRALNIISWMTLILAGIYNFYLVYKYAVNIPFWDEWDNFPTNNIFTWFEFRNEHKIVFTQMLNQISYAIDGWNIRHLIMFNWFVYAFTIGVLYKIVSNYCNNCPVLPLFFIPLFTSSTADNNLWAFQNQFHFTILFGLLAVWFGFVRNNGTKDKLLFWICIILSIFSQNFPFSFGILLIYLTQDFIFYLKTKDINYLKSAILSIVIYTTIILTFFIGYNNSEHGFQLVLPNKILFWKFFIIYLSFLLLGKNLICAISTIFYIELLFIYFLIEIKNKSTKNLGLYAIINASIFSLLAITVGRAYLGDLTARYFEIVAILIPASLAIFYNIFCCTKKIYLKILLIGFVFGIAVNYSHCFNSTFYKMTNDSRNIAKDCITGYYQGKNNGFCNFAYPKYMPDKLEKAKTMNFSFTRGFGNEK